MRQGTGAMRAERMGLWTANLLAITVLPAGLGRSGPNVLAFATYAIVAGLLLVGMEDVRYLRAIVTRSDVRSYLQVRIALIGMGALGPYLVGGVIGK